jgi:hypothetical protein
MTVQSFYPQPKGVRFYMNLHTNSCEHINGAS